MTNELDSPIDALRQLILDSEEGPIDRVHLKALIRDRYVLHARRYARSIDGRSVLPAAFTSTVASAIWLEATGSRNAPSVSARTSTLTSVGQYLSRLARVAKDFEKGLDALSSDKRFSEAEFVAKESSNTRFKKLERCEFESLEITLTADERQAIATVRRIIREHGRILDLIINSLVDDTD